jgi:hypothetical protein
VEETADEPPPKILGPSNAELEARSDLVAQVRVADIKWAVESAKPHLAILKLYRVTKGEPHYRHPLLAKLWLDRTVLVKMRRIKRDRTGRPLPGEWSDGYRVGDRVMTHLVWSEEGQAYLTISWNAVWQTPR